MSASLCPPRSSCAVASFVGEGPAYCCPRGCDDPAVSERSRRCEEGENYLHECTEESPCFQAHQARLAGTVYVPWRAESSGTAAALFAVWGGEKSDLSGAWDVWAVGSGGRVLRREDGLWRAETTPTNENIMGLWGSDKGVLWAVGGHGTILRRDPAGWVRVASPSSAHLYAIWGRASDALWTVGAKGTILRFDGQGWAREVSSTQADLSALHGAGDHIWAAGPSGVVLEQTPGGWRHVAVEPKAAWLGVYVEASGEVWLAGDGGTIVSGVEGVWRRQEIPVTGVLSGLWRHADTLWVVGQRGLVLKKTDGHAWGVVSYFHKGSPVDLFGLWGGGGSLFAVGGEGSVLVTRVGGTP